MFFFFGFSFIHKATAASNVHTFLNFSIEIDFRTTDLFK